MSRKNPYGQVVATIRCGLATASPAADAPNRVIDWTYKSDFGRFEALHAAWMATTRFDQAELRTLCQHRSWGASDCPQKQAWHAVVKLQFNVTNSWEKVTRTLGQFLADDPMATQIHDLEEALRVVDNNLAGCDQNTVTDRADLEQTLWDARRHLLVMERTNALARARTVLTGVDALKQLSRERRAGLAEIEADCAARLVQSITA